MVRPEDTVEHTVEVCPVLAQHRRILMEAISLSRPALVEAMVRGRRGGIGKRYLLRSSHASEVEGGVRAGAACFRHTPLPPPEETSGAVTNSGHRRRGLVVLSEPRPSRRRVVFHARLKELSAQIEDARSIGLELD